MGAVTCGGPLTHPLQVAHRYSTHLSEACSGLSFSRPPPLCGAPSFSRTPSRGFIFPGRCTPFFSLCKPAKTTATGRLAWRWGLHTSQRLIGLFADLGTGSPCALPPLDHPPPLLPVHLHPPSPCAASWHVQHALFTRHEGEPSDHPMPSVIRPPENPPRGVRSGSAGHLGTPQNALHARWRSGTSSSPQPHRITRSPRPFRHRRRDLGLARSPPSAPCTRYLTAQACVDGGRASGISVLSPRVIAQHHTPIMLASTSRPIRAATSTPATSRRSARHRSPSSWGFLDQALAQTPHGQRARAASCLEGVFSLW